jgi:hypothetical protein
MFTATFFLFALVALPIVSLWFAVDSREHDPYARLASRDRDPYARQW